MVSIVDIRKNLVFSIRFCWRSVCRHPFVAGLLLFMLFLYRYFPSTFIFLVYYSPVITCTSLLLGALLVYGEPSIAEPQDVKSLDVSAKGERNISEENFKSRRTMNAPKDDVFKQIHEGDGESNTILAASSSRKNIEKETRNEKTLSNEVESHDLKFMEKLVFSDENSAECPLPTAEGLKVEIKKPLDNQFESSLGSPWQQVNGRDVSSSSESDGEENSSSSDTSVADIVPIIDELNPLLESENLLQDHRSDSSDAVSKASSPEGEFDDGSVEEETENQADEEDEEAQEEKDDTESIVIWTADDEKNLMDLGSSELERNRRLENLIAKRRAKKLQRYQTDKNLIDFDTESLPFMEEISRLNVQIPAISAPRCNPFDLPFDSESMGLPPVPGSAPSVLLPRRNPFDLPYDQDEERSKIVGESSRTYDEPHIKPYFVAEKKIGTGFTSFERQLRERSDSKESSDSESDSVSGGSDQDHELSDSETHERISSVSQDVEADQRSDLSVQVGSEQEQNLADSVEEGIADVESSSPVSSSTNLEVIDERYDGSSSSSCSEEGEHKCNETLIHIEPVTSGLPVKGAEGTDDGQIADPVYDSSPSAQSTVSHIPSLDEDIFSKFKGKEGFISGSSFASDMEANLLNVILPPKAISEEDFISDEFNANLRGIKSVNEVSKSDTNVVDNFHVQELIPIIEVQELGSKSSKDLDSRIEDSCTENLVTPQYHLNSLHDQRSATEQPRALRSDSGSSSASIDGMAEVKIAEVHISESSVDSNYPVKELNQETLASATLGSTADSYEEDFGNSSKSLNPKYQIDLLL